MSSETAAANALDRILNEDLEFSQVRLDFSGADWLHLQLSLSGPLFDQSLTAGAMKGLIEFQNALFRSVSLILHDSAKISSLTDEEKSNSELNFVVTRGSSEVDADAKDTLINLASKAVGKMSGKLTFAAIVVIAIGYFGKEIYKAHLDSELDIAKVALESRKNDIDQAEKNDLVKLADSILNRQHESEIAISDAVGTSEKLSRIIEERDGAFEAIMKGADSSTRFRFQGIQIPPLVVQEINRSSRSRGRDVNINTHFSILSVDSSGKGSFLIKMRRISDGVIFNASLENSPRAEKYHKIFQRAEWRRSVIKVKLKARKFGDDDYRDAEIQTASTSKS